MKHWCLLFSFLKISSQRSNPYQYSDLEIIIYSSKILKLTHSLWKHIEGFAFSIINF